VNIEELILGSFGFGGVCGITFTLGGAGWFEITFYKNL